MKNIDRRKWLKWAGMSLLLLPLKRLFSVVDIRKRQIAAGVQPVEIAIPDTDISVIGDLLVVRSGDDINVYSSRCTHLGCRINSLADQHFVCPCHGSRFDRSGKPVNGPAIKPLTRLTYTINHEKQVLIVEQA